MIVVICGGCCQFLQRLKYLCGWLIIKKYLQRITSSREAGTVQISVVFVMILKLWIIS
jgi:hypothetical protein